MASAWWVYLVTRLPEGGELERRFGPYRTQQKALQARDSSPVVAAHREKHSDTVAHVLLLELP